jgi:hypothetical protein
MRHVDPQRSRPLPFLVFARGGQIRSTPRLDHSPLAYENTLCSITTALPTDLSRQKNENLSGLCSFGCVSPADIAKLFHKDPRIPNVPTPHDQNATHTRAPNRSSSVLHRGGATEFVLSTRTDSLTASDRSVMQSLAPTHAPFHPPPVMLPYVRTCFTGLLRWSGSVLGNVTSSRRDRWHLTQSATGASFKQCNPQIRISNNRQTLWTSSARCVFGKLVRRKPENMLMHTCRKLIQPSILPGLSAAATHARVQHSSQTQRRPDTCPRRVFT